MQDHILNVECFLPDLDSLELTGQMAITARTTRPDCLSSRRWPFQRTEPGRAQLEPLAPGAERPTSYCTGASKTNSGSAEGSISPLTAVESRHVDHHAVDIGTPNRRNIGACTRAVQELSYNYNPRLLSAACMVLDGPATMS